MVQNIARICVADQINGNPEKKTSEYKSQAQVRAEFVNRIMDKINGDDFDSEEGRATFESKIQQKIKSGAKLSQKEMNYLRKYNPYMYQQMVRVQQRREALKEQLRHCRTKEEAQRVMSSAMTSISDKDPAREAMIAAVQNVNQQFRSSEAYRKLPNTEVDLKKARKADNTSEDPFKAEDSDDEGESSAITYSFNPGGYQEAVADRTSNIPVFQMGA